jgi:hypothetical protein
MLLRLRLQFMERMTNTWVGFHFPLETCPSIRHPFPTSQYIRNSGEETRIRDGQRAPQPLSSFRKKRPVTSIPTQQVDLLLVFTLPMAASGALGRR